MKNYSSHSEHTRANGPGRIRARTSKLLSGALTALLSYSLVGQPLAAHDRVVAYAIEATIERARAINDLEGLFGREADLYGIIGIDGHEHQTRTVTDDNDISPDDWRHLRGVLERVFESRLYLTFKLRDYDDGFGGSDTKADINPDRGARDRTIGLEFDPDSGDGRLYRGGSNTEIGVLRRVNDSLWESELIHSRGGGDSNRAEIWFRIRVHRQPDFRITDVRPGVNEALIEIVNDGGPGVLTALESSVGNSHLGTVRNISFAAGQRRTVVGNREYQRGMEVWVGGRSNSGINETHTDNNGFVIE